MLISLSLLGTAHAFCGTFVAAEGNLTNDASELAIVRDERTTTLTMANAFEGPVDEFAMLIPVPEVVTEEQVHVVDPAVFDRLRGYSKPRMVTYTCEDLYPAPPPREPVLRGCYGGDKDEAGGWDDSGGMAEASDSASSVNVEQQFIVGEYEIVVLSAEDSGDLLRWLGNNGYAVSTEAAAMLQEYLDAGSYFFAAKVFTSRIPSGQEGLSPLQVSYSSEGLSLPIRLGTVNSPGSQDLVIYSLSSLREGRLGISNYPEATVPADCLLDQDELGNVYEQLFDEALDGEARWVVEHSWTLDGSSLHCDPCTEVPGLLQDDVATLGFGDFDSGDTGWMWNPPSYHFTRVHMRYSPEQATEDLALYYSGLTDQSQQRYIVYADYLEAEFPMCGTGWVAEPSSCAEVSREYARRMRGEDTENPNEAAGCAVDATGRGRLSFVALSLLGAVLLRRRR